MAKDRTLYKTLDLPETATPSEIKRRYRQLAKQHHPDAGGDAEEFRRVAAAYSVLIDPARRSRYDSTGTVENANPNELEGLLAQILTPLLDKVRDPISEARKRIDAQRSEFKSKIVAETAKIDKFERRIAAFDKKNAKSKNLEGRQLVRSIMQHQIEVSNRMVAQIEPEIARAAELLKMLDDLKYPSELEHHDDRRTGPTVKIIYT